MSSKDKKGKHSKVAPKVSEKLPEPVKDVTPPKDATIDEDDALDIDLSSVEVSSDIAEGNFLQDGPKLVLSDSVDGSYQDILSACSSTANSIKQSIHDVLNSRERVVITEVDPTAELQESLNQKIADFAQVIGNSFAAQDAVVVSPEETPKEEAKEKSPKAQTPEPSPPKVVEVQQIAADDKPTNTECKKGISEEDGTASLQIQASQAVKEVSKSAPPVEEDKISKKQKNRASNKKGEKSLDQLLKSMTGTAEEKLHLMGKKYLEAIEEVKSLEPKVKLFERQVISQQREKEQSQSENNRLILAKSRLEGLCRELQKQNKIIREESSIRLKLEEEKRKEIATKFQVTLTDISGLMQENSKNNTQLRAENAELATKLKSLVDNYEVWEQNVTKIVHQKELEAQLANAKQAKVNLLLKQETEKFLREKQSLLENLSELQKRCTLLAANELQLRTELADYTSKYEEFQNVLTNSSKVFANFKTDMDATSKKIKKLEKETNLYKQKWESSNKALLDMIGHKEKQDKEFSNAQQRISTLERLCRVLQDERNELRNQLKSVTPNPVPETSKEVSSNSTTEEAV